MRCLSCNVILNNYEATIKYEESGEYVDLCSRCLRLSDIPDGTTLERADLCPDKGK